jgi:outer membrane receptor protein involved in Fe transport
MPCRAARASARTISENLEAARAPRAPTLVTHRWHFPPSFTQTWRPVSYRVAYTFEPIRDLMFYSLYATSYDPAGAGLFSASPTNCCLVLTSTQTYETGVKQLLWDNRAEWTFAAYDITRRNVAVQVNPTTFAPPAKSPPRALNWPAQCVQSKA